MPFQNKRGFFNPTALESLQTLWYSKNNNNKYNAKLSKPVSKKLFMKVINPRRNCNQNKCRKEKKRVEWRKPLD